MRSRTITLVGVVAAVVVTCIAVAVPAQAPRDAGEVVPVTVTNFPTTVKVEGAVAIRGPIQDTSLATLGEVVVPPVKREDTNHYVDAGSVTTDGYSYAVVSIIGELKGQLQRPGDIGAIIVPEEEHVDRALAERGQLLLAEEVKVTPSSGASPYFAAKPLRFPIAFPNYKVYLYNAGDKAAGVTVHVYLTD
jgi:hypothetical protein